MTETLEIEIESLGAQGDGIGYKNGEPVFVPGTAPGDRVRATVAEKRRNGLHAILDEIVEPSENRITSACEHFGRCGGCQLQFLNENSYRDWLIERTNMALAHHGFDTDLVIAPKISPPQSRRRVALKALNLPGHLVLGFSEKQSHKLVDLSECPVSVPEITSLLKPLRALLRGILAPRMSAEVHLTLTATGVDMLVDAAMELDLNAREQLVAFAEREDVAAIHWRDQGFLDPVAIRREPMMNLSGTLVPLSPAAFVQATQDGEAALVEAVVDACNGYKRVADLFCGMGTFTFPLAKSHQVLAVEGAKQPLDALRLGANQASGLKQIIVKHRDLFRRPMTAAELSGFEAVVFDPPRAGAKEQAEELAKSNVQRIVGVSCNPNTFSRDARILADGGYCLERVVPIDQFLWSPHLELVGVFTRR